MWNGSANSFFHCKSVQMFMDLVSTGNNFFSVVVELMNGKFVVFSHIDKIKKNLLEEIQKIGHAN